MAFAVALVVGFVISLIPPPVPDPNGKHVLMNYLEIDSPHAESIVIAGRQVTFTAHFDRVERSHEIVWCVASEPGKKAKGPSFTHQWTQTGMDQVIATVDDLKCGIIIYAFKTESGGGTIGNLLADVSPPPETRTVESFETLQARAVRKIA